MKVFVIREYEAFPEGKVLISLPKLLSKLCIADIELWGFRYLTYRGKLPFGSSVDEFERLSRKLEKGFLLGGRDFQSILQSDFQIIDGFIDAYTNDNVRHAKFTIECSDSDQWEICTNSADVVAQLRASGPDRPIESEVAD